MQEAKQAFEDGKFKTITAAAHHFNVSHFTLRHRHQEKNGPQSKAQVKRRLLTEAQEQTLVDWVIHMGEIGQPLSKQALHVKVANLSDVLQQKTKKTGIPHIPLRFCIYGFLEWHPELALKRPVGLDAVRARNFNPTVVSRHFKLLDNLLKANDVPLKNLYNMDEKGIQLGGGRKLDGTKYFFSKEQRIRSRTQGASLELVTVIECVAADGSNLKLGFVFSSKNTLHEGYFKEEGIL